jgi:hypothetical protein
MGGVFGPKHPVTSPQKQKPQRERRGFYNFSGGPGRNRPGLVISQMLRSVAEVTSLQSKLAAANGDLQAQITS